MCVLALKYAGCADMCVLAMKCMQFSGWCVCMCVLAQGLNLKLVSVAHKKTKL